jgi:spore germination protein GerM
MLAGTLVATLAVVAACGVPAEDSPREIPTPPAPYRALTSPEPSESRPGPVAYRLFLVRDHQIVATTRTLPVYPSPEQQIQDLVAGPTAAERDSGLSSALTGVSIIRGVRVTDGIATVDVAEDVPDTGRTDRVLAYAQLVCTLSTRPEVTAVVFRLNGQRLSVPRSDGSLSPGPLTASDYASVTAGDR